MADAIRRNGHTCRMGYIRIEPEAGGALHPSRGENRKNVVVAMMRQKCTEKTRLQ